MKQRKNILIALTSIVALGGGIHLWSSKKGNEVQYRELPVKRGDFSVTILATGTVQPANRLAIKPPLAGRIETVLVQEGQKVRKGAILAWMSSTERAALLDAARSQGEEEVKKWEELYRPTPILAPIDGTIILRNVEPGQTFSNNDAVLVMSDRLTVKAQVDETDIGQLKLKQEAEIVLDAYSGQRIPARVDQIAFEAKTVNNVTTYTVDVLPEKTPPFMRAGMTANVTFLIHSKRNVLMIASEALKAQGGAIRVLVRSPSGKPIEREVQTGLMDGKQTEIVDGLNEGDVVLAPQPSSPGARPKQNVNPFSPMRPGGRNRGQ